MVDTPRTTAFLLASRFQDGQAAGSIVPQFARDMIVSIAPQEIYAVQYGILADNSTDNGPLINTMLGTLSSGIGYTIIFPRGNIVIGTQVTIPTTLLSPNGGFDGGLRFVGQGKGATRFVNNTTSVTTISCQFTTTTFGYNLDFEHICFYNSNASFNGWQIDLQNVSGLRCDGCEFIGYNTSTSATNGIHILGILSGTVPFIWAHYIERNWFIGASVSMDGCSDSWIMNNLFDYRNANLTGSGAGRNYGAKIINGGGNIKFRGNHVISAPNGGIWLAAFGASNISVVGNHFDNDSTSDASIGLNISTFCVNHNISCNSFFGNPSYGILATDIWNSVICNNAFTACGSGGNLASPKATADPMIQFNFTSSGIVGNVVSGNAFYTSQASATPAAAIFENGTVSGQKYMNNSFGGGHIAVPAIHLNGGGGDTVLGEHYGLVTRNGGTATITSGATTVVITHGLAYTPSVGDFTLTPGTSLGSGKYLYVDTITSTQATIHIDAAPGSSVTVGWRARYRETIGEA